MSLSIQKLQNKLADDPRKHALSHKEVKALILRRKEKRLMRRLAWSNRLKVQAFMKMSRGRKNVPTTMLGGLL